MKLPQSLEGKFESVFVAAVDRRVAPEHSQRHFDIVRNNYYYRGQQYLVSTEIGGAITYAPMGSSLVPKSNVQEELIAQSDFVTNVYKGEVRKFVNILGQRAPNVNATAAVQSNHSYQRRARIADEISVHLDEMWQVQSLHAFATFKVANNSQIYFYTPWVLDSDRYGKTRIPVYEEQMQPVGVDSAQCPRCGWMGIDDPQNPLCPECGAMTELIPAEMQATAVQVDEKEYENGAVECHIYSALEVTHDNSIRDLCDATWLDLDVEYDRGRLIQRYPHLTDYIRSASAGSGYGIDATSGARAREMVSSYSRLGDGPAHREKIRYKRRWLRPSEYNYIDPNDTFTLSAGEGADLPMKSVKVIDWVRQNFPDGMKICIVGNKIAAIYNESIDDVWAATPVEADETLATPAYMEDMIDCQDQVNDRLEISREADERSIPFTIANPSVLRPSTVDRMGRRVAEFVFAKPGAGGFGNDFYKVAGADPMPHIYDSAMRTLDASRQITGITEAIFGASSAQTLGEAEMNRNQALAVLGLSWFFLRKGWERAKRNGIMQVVRHATDGKIYYPKHADPFRRGVDLPDGYEELLDGGWKMESDESMPVTIAQIRTWLFKLLESPNVELPQQLGMFHLDNLDIMSDVFGVPGWVIPQHKDMLAINDIIEQLSQERPVEGVDPMSGAPIMESSQPPDEYLHDPAFAERAIREWLLSPSGKQVLKDNPTGWENVYLYGRSLWESMQPPPPLPGDPGEPIGEEPPPDVAEGPPIQ